ncbi:MAG: LON peptidase substrate-binding domain-containing protein [Cyclobacteriaceae bacterium]
MSESLLIPMFPLTLLPLPGELVPLHIFEPRYKQLLSDAETTDISFGIFLNHECNQEKLGALMKLESVIKRHPGGESDIVLRCIDIFSMEKLYRAYKTRLYPGGEIKHWKIDPNAMPGVELYELFLIFQEKRKINRHFTAFTLYQVATELNLDLFDRYKLLTLSAGRKENFLIKQLKFQIHVIRQEEKSKDVFHLN